MSLNKDIFLRSHVVEIDPKDRLVSDYDEPKWPEYALVFDTETTLDRRIVTLIRFLSSLPITGQCLSMRGRRDSSR
jgi:hypothetical protein